jgi:hypothetical protein
VFEVLLGRSAEKDLRRLPNPIHDRIVRVVGALLKTHGRLGAGSSPEARMIGGFASAITA